MRFLCTNDDGILAHGLEVMTQAASELGEVTVVAPDREQSATSHSLTLHHPVRPVQRGDRRWQVDGTPTDCVMLALEALMEERPDFVLSGVNHGHNMGEDVLYSGTVSAAMEGLMLGVPAIAFSFAGGDLSGDLTLLADQVQTVKRILQHFCGVESFPANTLLNINLPPLRHGEAKGIRLTRLGRRVYSNSLTEMKDPWGRRIYWIGGGTIEWRGEPDSDFQAIRDGYISVTPLHIDLTNFALLASPETWWRDL